MKVGQKNLLVTEPAYDFLKFYSEIFKRSFKEKNFPWFITFCPFHEDTKTPNLSVNVVTGRYKCFACNQKGSYLDFIITEKENGEYVYNLPYYIKNESVLLRIKKYETEERKHLDELSLRLEEKRSELAHNMLYKQPIAFIELKDKRGLTEDTIKKYKLGFLKGTVTIPIRDIDGRFVSLKFHKRKQTVGAHTQMFPWDAVSKDQTYVILVEGEFDAMVTRQYGFNAVTLTNGAMSWDSRFCRYLKNKNVYIAYDNDKAGIEATVLIAKSLEKTGITTKIIVWPKFMKDKEDNVDFFVKYKMNKNNYRFLLKQAIPFNQFKKRNHL